MSERSAREVAFLRDLSIDKDWTARFTNLLDENLILPEDGALLYVEPGAGDHLLALPEKMGETVALFSVHADPELLRIADAKAHAVGIDVDFRRPEEGRLPFPDEEFQAVIADASFLPPADLPAFLSDLYRVTALDGHVSFFLPTAAGYGEFFSILWEALFNLGLQNLGEQVERLIAEIPTIAKIEETAKIAGFSNVQSRTKTEVFDYENGTEFMNSFLMTEFLLPRWLHFLTAGQKEKIVPEMIRTIDEDRTSMTFRLSVKATVVNGKRT